MFSIDNFNVTNWHVFLSALGRGGRKVKKPMGISNSKQQQQQGEVGQQWAKSTQYISGVNPT